MMVKYVNSCNECIEFYSSSIKVSNGSLHCRKWTVSDDITKENISYKLTLTLRGNLKSRKEKLDKLLEIFDIDVINNIKGRLYVGEYYLKCFVVSSSTSINTTFNNRTDVELEFYGNQKWIKEKIFNFVKELDIKSIKDSKIYPYVYSYKYGYDIGKKELINESIFDSNFKIIIYGGVSNPSIMIGENLYKVDCELSSSQYLVIDSNEREIYIVDNFGFKINVFNSRNKDYNIFQKIKSGINQVSWSGGFGFDLIVFDERSEPKWI